MDTPTVSKVSAVSILLSVAALAPAAASGPIKAVFLKDGQIFYRYDLGAEDIQLTHADTVKFLPVWSRDGRQIAFIEQAPESELGRLVVIDERGRRLEEVALDAEEPTAGMRYIETLEWISPLKLAVSGGVNPSLTETRLIDLEGPDPKELNIFDDGLGADFSPSGEHFASTSGSPHFTPERFREPALHIDFLRIYPEPGAQVRFITERAWSPEGSALAVVAEEASTGKLTLVVWRPDQELERRPLPLPARQIEGLVWSSGTILVKTGAVLVRPREDGQPEPWEDREVLQAAEREAELRGALSRRLEGEGRQGIDFWCESCELTASPRKATLAE